MKSYVSYLTITLLLLHKMQNIVSSTNQCVDCTHITMGRLLTLEQRVTDMEERVVELEDQNKQLRNTENNLRQEVIKLAEENRELNNTVAYLGNQMIQLGNWHGIKGQESPAFIATMTTAVNVSYNMTVVFDTPVYDIANNYNNSTGTFKATMRGRYLISVSARSEYRKHCHPGIYKNGRLIVYAFSGQDPDRWSSSGSVTAVLDLDVDDEVSIRDNDLSNSGAYRAGSFTGVLLYQF